MQNKRKAKYLIQSERASGFGFCFMISFLSDYNTNTKGVWRETAYHTNKKHVKVHKMKKSLQTQRNCRRRNMFTTVKKGESVGGGGRVFPNWCRRQNERLQTDPPGHQCHQCRERRHHHCDDSWLLWTSLYCSACAPLAWEKQVSPSVMGF